MSAEHSEGQLSEEIRGLVEQELLRLGRKVTPRVEARALVVGKGADEARADIGGSLLQWESLPDDLRERRVKQIAELLAQAAGRASVSRRPPAPQRLSNKPGLLCYVMPLLMLVGFVAVVLLAFRYLSPNGEAYFTGWRARLFDLAPKVVASAASLASANVDAEPQRAVLASAACGAASTRVARGAVISTADVEGWQVELVLLRRGPPVDLSASAALSKFFRRKPASNTATVTWPSAPTLAEVERFDALVEIDALPTLGSKNLSGVSLVFNGPYVVPYFAEDTRADYFKLADALASALGSTDGALFARCSNVNVHHIGSWFIGATPGGAITSLVYFMAGYSDTPVLKPEVLGTGSDAMRQTHAFDTISQAASVLDRSAVSMLIGNELGMISGGAGKPARITFAFRDANRATRASVEAASSLRLARLR